MAQITPILNLKTNVLNEELSKDLQKSKIQQYVFKNQFTIRLLGEDVPDFEQLFAVVITENMFFGHESTIKTHSKDVNVVDHNHAINDYFPFTIYSLGTYMGWGHDKSTTVINPQTAFITKTFPGCCGVLTIHNNYGFYKLPLDKLIVVLKFFFKKYGVVQLFDYVGQSQLKQNKEKLESIGFIVDKLSKNPKTSNVLTGVRLTKDDFNKAVKNLNNVKVLSDDNITVNAYKQDIPQF